MLAVHLEIPALEFLTKSGLQRSIDEGYFPSRPMLVRASVICHEEDRSRQMLQDAVCLTLADSPSEEKSFRNSNSLTNAELAPKMWLAELRDTIDHLVDLRKLGGNLEDPFNKGKTFWTTDKIKSSKALYRISLGLSHALTTGALNDWDVYAFYCGDENHPISNFQHLQARGYLHPDHVLPLTRPKRDKAKQLSSKLDRGRILKGTDCSGAVPTSEDTASPPSESKPAKSGLKVKISLSSNWKRKLEASATESSSKAPRRSTSLASKAAPERIPHVHPASTDKIEPEKAPSAANVERAFTIVLADGIVGPMNRESAMAVAPRIQAQILKRPFLTRMHLDFVGTAHLDEFFGFARRRVGDRYDWHKWDMKTKFMVILLAEHMYANDTKDRADALLRSDFRNVVANLTHAEWVIRNTTDSSILRGTVIGGLHYVLVRNGYEKKDYHMLVSEASGDWTYLTTAALIKNLDHAYKLLGEKDRLAQHPALGSAYVVHVSGSGSLADKLKGTW